MKWTKKGHELDAYVSAFDDSKSRNIYVFGFGQLGTILAETLYANKLLGGIIDNDEKKQNQVVYGKKIMSLHRYLSEINGNDSYIVIAAIENNQREMEEELKENGLVYGKNYFYHDGFLHRILPVLMAYKKDRTFASFVQISLTERCTLKCKKCAHACYAVSKDAEDLLLTDVYKSMDSLFGKVDYVQEFVLIGGEPLLYKQIAEVIRYTGSKYRNQMSIFSITTNGTIVPSKEVLELCQKYRILFRISNYSKELPQLKKNHERLVEALERYGISYRLANPEAEWMDYGFEYVNRGCAEEELIKVFSSCNTPCREIRGNKYYYCVMARTVSDNLKYHVGQADYLDLDKLTGENYKKELLEFNLGYSEKGYLDMCRHCHGKDTKNYIIPAAEQLKF